LQTGSRQALWLFISGLTAGLALLLKFMFLPIFVGFWFIVLWRNVAAKEKRQLATVFAIGLPVALGVLIPLLAMKAHLAYQGALQIALWTFFIYPVNAVNEWPLNTNLGTLTDGVMWFLRHFAPLLALSFFAVHSSVAGWKNHITQSLILWVLLGSLVILVQRLSWFQYHFMLLFVPLGILGARGMDILWARLQQTRSPIPTWQRRVILPLAFFFLFEPIWTAAVIRSITVTRHGFLTRSDRGAYQANISKQYAEALKEVVFLREPESSPGDIYVFADSLYYYLSGRYPAVPILTRRLAPPELWARILERLHQTRPVYIFVHRTSLEEYRQFTPRAVPYIDAAVGFIDRNYSILSESNVGIWYIRTQLVSLSGHTSDELSVPAELAKTNLHVAA
jgi:hypothetical protein